MLDDTETLFFLHIPKAAGMSLTAILDEAFEEDEIFQPQDWRDAPAALEKMSVVELARIRCVRGHYWFGPGDRAIHDRITIKPVVMTMLRDPVARVVSVHQHVMRWPQHWLREEIGLAPGEEMSLADFVVHPGTQGEVFNLQTRLIVGDVPGNPVRLNDSPEGVALLDPEELLVIACARLRSFAWVGLVERMAQSVELLTTLMGWDPVETIPALNANAVPSTQIEMSDETRTEILMRNGLDAALYAHAAILFDEALVLARLAHPV